MTDITDKMARELFAAEYRADGFGNFADEVLTRPFELLNSDEKRALRAIAAALQAQQPGAQAVAYCDPSDPINSTAFAWPGTDRTERHREPLFTHPQPPSIPEPSEADVEAVSIASGLPIKFPNDRKRVVDALTTYTARLRERIWGGK